MLSKKNVILYLDCLLFALLCVISIWSYSKQMTDYYILPKWLFTIGSILIFTLIISVKRLFGKRVYLSIPQLLSIITILSLLQMCHGMLQWMGIAKTFHADFSITGNYDNPAGFSATLCISFPYLFYLYKKYSNAFVRTGVALSAILVVLCLFLSGSRTGLLCCSVITGIYLFIIIPIRLHLKVMIYVFIYTFFIIAVYYWKQDSADGRLLIWLCSLNMIKDNIWTGFGIGAFRKHYMDYQASYFETSPDSPYIMLADNVISPFNEYLNIVMNWGIIGLFLLCAFVVSLIKCYKKKPNLEKRIALFSLLSVALLGCFSYPLNYPFVWIVIAINAYIIAKGNVNWIIGIFKYKVFWSVIILLNAVLLIQLHNRISAEYRWHKVAYYASDENMEDMKNLRPLFHDNPYFLYNYACLLNEQGDWENGLLIAHECRKCWADYDLELLLGDIYRNKKEFNNASIHYLKATSMCPVRFTPLYKLYELYKENGEQRKQQSIGKAILEKPIKINSITIQNIKRKVRKDIKQNI